MAHLVDTSILARLANTSDALHALAARAVFELHQRGELLHITAQNLVEFRNLATRPAALNGLGLSIAVAEAKAAIFEAKFPPRRDPRHPTGLESPRSCTRDHWHESS
jgi:hypothetical protein